MSANLNEMKAKLPGAEGLLHELLGCEFGHGRVAHPADPEPCQEQAVQIVVLHGTPVGDLSLKLCERHRDLVLAESTPRDG